MRVCVCPSFASHAWKSWEEHRIIEESQGTRKSLRTGSGAFSQEREEAVSDPCLEERAEDRLGNSRDFTAETFCKVKFVWLHPLSYQKGLNRSSSFCP